MFERPVLNKIPSPVRKRRNNSRQLYQSSTEETTAIPQKKSFESTVQRKSLDSTMQRKRLPESNKAVDRMAHTKSKTPIECNNKDPSLSRGVSARDEVVNNDKAV